MFRTAFEIDQRWVVELAADRTPYICQGQSLNLFLAADIDKWDLHMLHWTAWEKGLKSPLLLPLQIDPARRLRRLEKADKSPPLRSWAKTDYEECLACQ